MTADARPAKVQKLDDSASVIVQLISDEGTKVGMRTIRIVWTFVDPCEPAGYFLLDRALRSFAASERQRYVFLSSKTIYLAVLCR